ncbi:MAG TPA: hypothetical protein VF407_15300 [Polyangiaceae bacterium]
MRLHVVLALTLVAGCSTTSETPDASTTDAAPSCTGLESLVAVSCDDFPSTPDAGCATPSLDASVPLGCRGFQAVPTTQLCGQSPAVNGCCIRECTCTKDEPSGQAHCDYPK